MVSHQTKSEQNKCLIISKNGQPKCPIKLYMTFIVYFVKCIYVEEILLMI